MYYTCIFKIRSCKILVCLMDIGNPPGENKLITGKWRMPMLMKVGGEEELKKLGAL